MPNVSSRIDFDGEQLAIRFTPENIDAEQRLSGKYSVNLARERQDLGVLHQQISLPILVGGPRQRVLRINDRRLDSSSLASKAARGAMLRVIEL